MSIFYKKVVSYTSDLLSTHTVLFCRFGSTTGRIWLDNVRCSGTESRLTSCSRNSYGSHNCVHSDDVAIDCSATTTGNFTVNVHKCTTRL